MRVLVLLELVLSMAVSSALERGMYFAALGAETSIEILGACMHPSQ
jgi:hypothetical protein